MEKDYSIAEIKKLVEKYGMTFLSDDELIYLITGKKKPNKFVLDAMAEYKDRHRTNWNVITNPLSLVPFIAYLSTEQFEKFGIACLDGSRKLISSEILFSGSPNKAMVDMPSVLRHALLKNARAVIVYHNHPSGTLSFSDDDINLTEALKKAFDSIGIDMLDHIIVASGSYVSYLEETDKEIDD